MPERVQEEYGKKDAARSQLSEPWQEVESGGRVENHRGADEIESEYPIQDWLHDNSRVPAEPCAIIRSPRGLLPPRLRLQECPLLEFLERLPELILRVHHDGAVPRYRLLEWLPGDQEEPDALVPGVHRDLVAAVE